MPGSFTDEKYDVKKKTLNVKKANIAAVTWQNKEPFQTSILYKSVKIFI